MSHAVYERAAEALFHTTYGGLADRDRIKVVQLFDRLLAAGYSVHSDELRVMCRDAGYDQPTADDIGLLFDDLCLIRRELENPSTINYWSPERMEQIIGEPVNLGCHSDSGDPDDVMGDSP